MEITIISPRSIRFTLKPLGTCPVYCYLIKGEKYFYLIDSGAGSQDMEPVVSYIKSLDPQKEIVLINSHYHWDHIWGNAYVPALMIVAHKKSYDCIQKKWKTMYKCSKQFLNGETKMCLPNILFEDKLNFVEDGLELFYSKGHTIDGICIYDSIDKKLYVGDNIGDDDEYIVPQLENSVKEYLKALNEMKKYDFDYLLSGHNRVQPKSFIDLIIQELENEIQG